MQEQANVFLVLIQILLANNHVLDSFASAELWNVKIFNGAVDKCSLKEVRVG